ncbi:hypothetical protein SDC9_200994 [bioreactor metagenome]|uniref:Uncharacterized protein n=1 Tax=bioreactor metagenome TaxID=1076179 RepID=A0A645IQU5_9ZZZZ
MGAGAQVGELALLIEGDGDALRKIVDQLHLIGLALILHELDGLGPGQLKPLQLQLLLADFPHLGLHFLQYLRGKGERGVHIIVEALVDRGADGQLHLRVQALHGLSQNVGAGVPISFAVCRVFKRVLILFGHFCSSLYWG